MIGVSRHNSPMRVTHDRAVNAAYIYLTDEPLSPGRETVIPELPTGVDGEVVLDFRDGRLVGIEILGASRLLHRDLLAEASS